MKKVLWLASWYPNLIEPLTGDFIERHAKAASSRYSVSVIHVLKERVPVISEKVFREKRVYNSRCQAIITYYKVPVYKLRWVSRVIAAYFFLKHFISEANLYISQNGKPELVHVHVCMKAGLIALWLKWVHHIPYVITEHWTGFCPGARPNFDEQNLAYRFCWRMIMKEASGCSTVSDYLGLALKSRLKTLEYMVIPNVVDTEIFRQHSSAESDLFRFIHVSTLNYQKNIAQIFEAIKILSVLTNKKFQLTIYGPEKPELFRLAKELNIENKIVFKNESSQPELAKDMQQCGALILYSLYETFGCVIIEANACGLPVIVSDIPVFHENVLGNVTGVFVPLNQPPRLAGELLKMMNDRTLFNETAIIDITKKKYSFEAVAALFDAFYDRALNSFRS